MPTLERTFLTLNPAVCNPKPMPVVPLFQEKSLNVRWAQSAGVAAVGMM